MPVILVSDLFPRQSELNVLCPQFVCIEHFWDSLGRMMHRHRPRVPHQLQQTARHGWWPTDTQFFLPTLFQTLDTKTTQLNQNQIEWFSFSFHFSCLFLFLFICFFTVQLLSVVLQLDKGDYPENVLVWSCPNEQHFFQTSYVFGSHTMLTFFSVEYQ